MSSKARVVAAIAFVASVSGIAPMVMAADPPDLFLERLDNFNWTGAGGNSTWQNASNWSPPAGHAGQFPNDPNRIDDGAVPANVQTINSLIGANLSGPRASDLTVNIATTDVTVASLKLGGTTTAITTDVTSSPSGMSAPRLVFENAELNDTLTNPGDLNATPPVQPAPIWSFNQGNALIWSTGTAAVGKVNRISAGVLLNDNVDVEGDRDLHIYGEVFEGVRDRNPNDSFTELLPTSINNLMSADGTLFIHGNIRVTVFDEDVMPGTQDRMLGLNVNRGVSPPPNPNAIILPTEETRQGNLDISGTLIGDGWVEVGSPAGSLNPLGAVILRGDSRNIPGVGSPDPEGEPGDVLNDPFDPVDPYFEGRLILNRANLVLAHDGALGSGDLKTGNPTQGFGFNFISDADNRKIANPINIAQWQTVRGASDIEGLESIGDHSIEFSGPVVQDNTRGWVNLLPSGKTLTLSGAQYPLEGDMNTDSDRIYTIDGTGKTIISGGIHNREPSGSNPAKGHFRVRGTGAVYVDWDNNQQMIPDPNNPEQMILDPEDRFSSYIGDTIVEGGNLHFATNDDMPDGGEIVSSGGAIGNDSGVTANATFLGMINNSSNPSVNPGGTPTTAPFFRTFQTTTPIFANYDSGGLMLATPAEYAQNLDFTSSPLSNAANMTLSAHESGSTYTGTITPSSTVAVNKDTYQLGGGSGALTLPNANQLTGARSLLVTNGGEVRLTNTNNYTGVTKIQAKYLSSVQDQAIANDTDAGHEGFAENILQMGTTLSVTTLTNGGAASSIGTSTNASTNLVIQGSTLKYTGAATSTDRLFTVGTAGATIDSSGSGALNFTNTSALGIDVAENRQGVAATGVTNNDDNEIFGIPTSNIQFSTEDLVPGMAVKPTTSVPQFMNDDPDPLEITEINSPHVIKIAETHLSDDNRDSTVPPNPAVNPPNPWPGYPDAYQAVLTFDFGPAPARLLTLTGSNSASNTLASLVGDASDRDEPGTGGGIGKKGSVGIRKTGVGKWILNGNNTYTGVTNVEKGALVVNGTQTGTGLTTVSAGATLSGTGTLGGSLTNEGTVAPGASAGTMTATGNFIQSSSGKLDIELGGTGAGAFDKLVVLAGQAIASVKGDYNNNGTVDAADYSIWRDHYGQKSPTYTLLNEEPDTTPGEVTVQDYNYWKDHFGETIITGTASLAGTINISLINGFTPTPGNMFTILTAPTGITANVSLTGQSSGFQLIVNPTSLVLSYTGAGSGTAVPEPSSALSAVLAVAACCGRGMARKRRC